MADLFDQSGHITDDAIMLLSREEADELGLLEISEHLSFCDECLIRYTQMLTDDTLMEPEHSLTESIMSRIKSKARVIFLSRFVTMGVAAAFAIIFWVTGVFSYRPVENHSKLVEGISYSAADISQRATQITQSISDSINSLFDYIGGGNN